MIFSAPPCSLKYAAFTGPGPPPNRFLEWHFRALVHHASGLVIPAWQRAGLRDLHGRAQPQARAQAIPELDPEPFTLGERQGRGWVDADEDLVQTLVAPED